MGASAGRPRNSACHRRLCYAGWRDGLSCVEQKQQLEHDAPDSGVPLSEQSDAPNARAVCGTGYFSWKTATFQYPLPVGNPAALGTYSMFHRLMKESLCRLLKASTQQPWIAITLAFLAVG